MTQTAKLVVACFFIFLASQLWFKVCDSDVWFHLNIGRFILQHHLIPSVNTFSFTEPNQPWMPHEWLSQVIFYSAYSLFGAAGLALVRLAVFLTIFALLFRLVHAPGWEAANVVALMATTGVILSRFNDRPEMFSALFLVSYFYISERWKDNQTKWIWLIPVMQVFWINMHGYYLFGLLFLFLFWLGEFGLKEGFLLKSTRSRELAKVGGISLVACLVNPHFHQGILRLLSVAHQIGDPHVIEWQPPYYSFAEFWRTPWMEAEKRLVWITGLLLLLNLRRRRTTHWLLWAVFLLAFLKSGRNVLFFALVAIPIMLLNLRLLLEGFTAKMKAFKLKPLLEIGLAGLLIFGAYDVASGDYYSRNGIVREWGVGISGIFPPVEACDFMEKQGIEGPSFNNYGIGNYLMWRFPDRKVFIDGRNLEAYSPEFLSYYHRLTRGRISIPELLGKYPIRSFIISHTYPDTDTMDLIDALRKDPKWKLIYVDHTSVIFVPLDRAKARKLFIENVDGVPVRPKNRWGLAWTHYELSYILAHLGRTDDAIAESRKALDIEPGFWQASGQLDGLLAEKEGAHRRRSAADASPRSDPKTPA